MATTAPETGKVIGNYVGGQFVDVDPSRDRLEDRNPATGEVLAQVPLSGAVEVEAAVAAARAAFPAWRATSPMVRARAVMKLREVLDAHREELARLLTTDMGKTFDDAFGEVGRGIESVEHACAIPVLLKGENLEGIATGVDVELVRQPVGVIAAITPFNFPAMIPLWFLPYAIACGNTFILKPSEQDPLVSMRIMELIDGIDEIPKGVVNLVNGGRDCVEAILESPGINGVSFVGSATTARIIATRCAEVGKRCQALGGAKNSMVLMPDADPDVMTQGVLGSAFGAAGQRCLAGSVAVLVGSKEEQDRTLQLVVEAASKLVTGDGADPATDVCPVVTPASRERIEAEIAAAEAGGCEIVLDGRRDGGLGGAELAPTIIDGAGPDHNLIREELFGPVLAITRAADLAEALELVNASRYGNASVIFTSSGKAARDYRYGVEAGMVGVNVGVAAPVAWFPFSGWKDSIDGDLHANGSDAVRFYTRSKVVTSRW
jgi:malonate-semialdehyde dehydrogenase (acetylating)/methylmalonate-semialdehyde dehydrogenase